MDLWNFVDLSYSIGLSIVLFIFAFLMFFIGYGGHKAKNRYGAISTIVTGTCLIIFGLYNLIFRFFPYPYNGFMVWWLGFVLLINGIFVLIIKLKMSKMDLDLKISRKGEEVPEKISGLRRYVEKMIIEDPYKEDIPFKMELVRKSFHLMGILVIIGYFWLTRLISDGVILLINQVEPSYEFLWGDISLFPHIIGDLGGQARDDLTMMGLLGALIFALVSDIYRILKGPEYSLLNFISRSILRNKEKNALGPQIYIVTGFVFSYMLYMAGFLNIESFFAGVLIACFSDAAAALIGRKYGKHKIILRSKDTKSIEGFFAGVVVAYIIGLIFVGPIYALIGAAIFFLTDYFPAVTADNILNPIFIPIGIQLFILLLGLPVGW
ncbi:MAG: phosphatidate cytidylyltransferase [Candidatus Hodarchaeota archaeon]